MKSLLFFLLLIFQQLATAQITNDRDAIVRNNVKSCLEKHCFINSEEICTVIYEAYDRRGNCIEFDMGRLGTIYKYIYDDNNNLILHLWVDKTDSSEIDSVHYKYDENKKLILHIAQNDTTRYHHKYDSKGNLIETVSKSMNVEGNIVEERINYLYTNFGKIQSEKTTTRILEVSKKSAYSRSSNKVIEYNYDDDHKLIKKTYYEKDKLLKTIEIKYDSLNRVTEEIEYDPDRVERVKRMGYRGRRPLTNFITKYNYSYNGQIDETYTYFSDPCMNLDNHFLFKHFYLENGLLDRADVFEEGKLVFTIKYDYEYYN